MLKKLIPALCIVALAACAKKYEFKTNSMTPTFKKGDTVEMVTRDAAGLKHGELVIFSLENPHKMRLVRRVLGLPGDTLSVRDGALYRNDQQLSEPYTKGTTKPMSALQEPFKVPPAKVFVMGDNRENSIDSRYFGALDYKMVEGVVKQ